MSTSWTITASDIIRGALELNSAIDPTEAVSAEDTATCLRALNGIIKEMPLHGLSWPKLTSTAVALSWDENAPYRVSPPANYFGVPVLKFTDENGRFQQLRQLPRVNYEALDQGAAQARYPQFFYEAPDRTFALWPTPTENPLLVLDYQAIGEDVSLTAQPDVQQAYLGLLELWVADKTSLKFSTPRDQRMEIAARFGAALELMKQWAVETAPICISVDDYAPWRGFSYIGGGSAPVILSHFLLEQGGSLLTEDGYDIELE